MNLRTRILNYIFGRKAQFIEVDTNKLKDRGINKGDMVIVDTTKKPAPGDLGVIGDLGKGEIKEVKGKNGKWRGKVVMVLKDV